MGDLYKVIVSQIDTLSRELEDSFTVAEADAYLCHIHSSKLIIDISVDQRDGSIVSGILFKEENGVPRDYIDTHVGAHLFPNSEFSFHSTGSLESNVKNEINNIILLIGAMKDSDISARDLYYFYQGYANGYTQHYST